MIYQLLVRHQLLLLLAGGVLLLLSSCTTLPQPLGLPEKDRELRLEITHAMLVANRTLIEIRYRIYGDLKVRHLNPKETYIVDEQSGEIIFTKTIPKLFGGSRPMPLSYIVFPNNGLIKKDSLITVVIGGLRVEHVRVNEVSTDY